MHYTLPANPIIFHLELLNVRPQLIVCCSSSNHFFPIFKHLAVHICRQSRQKLTDGTLPEYAKHLGDCSNPVEPTVSPVPARTDGHHTFTTSDPVVVISMCEEDGCSSSNHIPFIFITRYRHIHCIFHAQSMHLPCTCYTYDVCIGY